MVSVNCGKVIIQIVLSVTSATSISQLTETQNHTRSNNSQIPQNKVKLKVFYETLCPGSISFFVTELRPAVEQLGSYLDLELVPYGFAKTHQSFGNFSFHCQHGQAECFGNRVHACVLDSLKNNTKAALFNACLMSYTYLMSQPSFDYKILVNWCNFVLSIRTAGIWSCVHGGRSSQLLKMFGDETRAMKPPYVPYILMYRNPWDSPVEVAGNLIDAICGKLEAPPPACH